MPAIGFKSDQNTPEKVTQFKGPYFFARHRSYYMESTELQEYLVYSSLVFDQSELDLSEYWCLVIRPG